MSCIDGNLQVYASCMAPPTLVGVWSMATAAFIISTKCWEHNYISNLVSRLLSSYGHNNDMLVPFSVHMLLYPYSNCLLIIQLIQSNNKCFIVHMNVIFSLINKTFIENYFILKHTCLDTCAYSEM